MLGAGLRMMGSFRSRHPRGYSLEPETFPRVAGRQAFQTDALGFENFTPPVAEEVEMGVEKELGEKEKGGGNGKR